MKTLPRLYEPKLDFRFSTKASFRRHGNRIFIIEIENGDRIDAICEEDYLRTYLSIDSVLETHQYKSGRFFKAHMHGKLKAEMVVRDIVKLLAFDLPGSYTATIELLDEFVLEYNSLGQQILSLGCSIELDMQVIDKEL